MTERITLRLWEPVTAHRQLAEAWTHIKALLMAGHRLVVEIKPETRSDAQNRRLWAMLADIAAQVDWYGQKLTSEEWKCVFSSAMKREKVVPGIDGGFVVCGQSTSKMTRAEMSEMQCLMEAFGADKGVVFKDQGDM